MQFREYHAVLAHYVSEKTSFFKHDKFNSNVIIEYFQKNPSHLRIIMTSLLNYIYGLMDPNNIDEEDLSQQERLLVEE